MSRINIGGQAVMEGVMMRNNDRYAVAVRKPDRQIEVKTNRCTGTSDRPAVCNLPIVRGVFSFVQSLTIGVKTLMYSAQFFEDEEEEAPKKEKKKKKEKTKEQESRAEKAEMAGTVTFSIVLAVGLFMLLPAWIASLLDAVIKSHVLIGLIEGVIRLAIFLGYVIAISRMEDIKRRYMYHAQNWRIQLSLSNGHGLTASTMISRPQPGQKCQPFSVGPSASKFSMYPHARHRQASCSRSTHSYTALFSLMVYPSRIFFTARSCSRV